MTESSRVIVSAASQGLGRAIAAEFGRRSARIVVGARSVPGLEETVELARKAGAASASWRSLDLFDAESVQQFISAAVAELGGLDTLVVNCGGPAPGGFGGGRRGGGAGGVETLLLSAGG